MPSRDKAPGPVLSTEKKKKGTERGGKRKEGKKEKEEGRMMVNILTKAKHVYLPPAPPQFHSSGES